MEHEGYGIIWNRNVMEYEFYESYRIGKIRNEVECPTGLESHPLYFEVIEGDL